MARIMRLNGLIPYQSRALASCPRVMSGRRLPFSSTTCVATASTFDGVQLSVPHMLPSPIRVMRSGSTFMIRCTTYRSGPTWANTTCPRCRLPGFCSITLSRPPNMKGSMLRPLTGNVTLTPSCTRRTASCMICSSVIGQLYLYINGQRLHRAGSPDAIRAHCLPVRSRSHAGRRQCGCPTACPICWAPRRRMRLYL